MGFSGSTGTQKRVLIERQGWRPFVSPTKPPPHKEPGSLFVNDGLSSFLLAQMVPTGVGPPATK